MIKLYMSQLSIYLYMVLPNGKVYVGYSDGTWGYEGTLSKTVDLRHYDLVGTL